MKIQKKNTKANKHKKSIYTFFKRNPFFFSLIIFLYLHNGNEKRTTIKRRDDDAIDVEDSPYLDRDVASCQVRGCETSDGEEHFNNELHHANDETHVFDVHDDLYFKDLSSDVPTVPCFRVVRVRSELERQDQDTSVEALPQAYLDDEDAYI